MIVSDHCELRYFERVEPYCQDWLGHALTMWETGRVPLAGELTNYGVPIEAGKQYRIGCDLCGVEHLLIAEGECIKTILIQKKLMKRDRKKPPRTFAHRRGRARD